ADLKVGGTITFVMTATISTSASGSITNTATVNPPIGFQDTNPNDNTASDTDTLAVAQVDLSITKNDGVTSVVPGGSTVYTIVVSNNGPSSVVGAHITDQFPAAITSATWTATASGGAAVAASSGSGSIDTTADLPVGGTVTFSVTAHISASATGDLINTAVVATPPGVVDTNPGNNQATDTDTLTAQTDLAITKSDGVTSVVAGGSTVYTITVVNNGPSAVTGATITDPFPAGISSATWTAVASAGSAVAAG